MAEYVYNTEIGIPVERINEENLDFNKALSFNPTQSFEATIDTSLILSTLTFKEKELLLCLFWLDWTFDTAGKYFGMSSQGCHQWFHRIISKLKIRFNKNVYRI